VTEVVALAKRPLQAGERLDGIGGFTIYGMLENSTTAREQGLLPMGLTDGAIVVRPIEMDAALTFDDVSLREDGWAVPLWNEQARLFHLTPVG
jgi:predicted homoserine dehydrogenase-like protein